MQSNSKCIVNSTGNNISVTIHIAELNEGQFKVNGTKTIELGINESQDIHYGDLTSSYLTGIVVSTVIDGAKVSSTQTTQEHESDFCLALNNNHIIEINDITTLQMAMLG